MKVHVKIFLTIICVLTLTGCVTREQADLKLQRGCIAGVKALLPPDVTFGKFKEAIFQHSPVGPDYRHVTIKAIEMDGWLETDAVYECVFQESFGFMNANYIGSIYQVHIGDEMYGQAGSHITGSIDDFLKLTEAVRVAMYE